MTNHSLRRTYCALLYESAASPAYVMQQMGHTDAALALAIYSKVMERKPDTGARMDKLIRGAEWAAMGANGAPNASRSAATPTKMPDFQLLRKLRGRDSNPNFLIQSQASYR